MTSKLDVTYTDRGEQMRAQIQEIAGESVYGGSPTESLKWAKEKLARIANIAEAGEPDEDWDGGSVSGEEFMAEREPDAEDVAENYRVVLARLADWIRDEETDGSDCGDFLAEQLTEAGFLEKSAWTR